MNRFDTIHTQEGKRFLFRVETSQDLSDFKKYENLRFEIWGDPRDSLAGARNLGVENYFHDGSNCLIGVYIEDADGNFRRMSLISWVFLMAMSVLKIKIWAFGTSRI